ncbi:MarR family winged helix-turn-helix transcriptional regulator, partial [Rhizobiaceae sp. 2RAB30]
VTLSRLGDNVRQGQLADELGVEGPSLVRIVDLLLAEKLVGRVEDPVDRRAKMLSLTESGRKRVAEIERILGVLRADLLNEISGDELHVTVTVLERLESELLGREGKA